MLVDMNRKNILSAEEIDFYHENGFVVPKYRLSKADLGRLQSQVFKVVEDNPHMKNIVITAAHVASTAEQGLASNGDLKEFTTHPDLLDMIEQIAGPDLVLWTTSIFHKPAIEGIETPWHQDANYWPMEPMATTSYWIAVSDSDTDNGCVRVLPGSHRHATLSSHKVKQQDSQFSNTIDLSEDEEKVAVDVVLEAGQMMLFDAFIAHGARANSGVRPRTGFAARYMPATSFFDHDHEYNGHRSFADRALFLVRGEDISGRNDFVRNHPPR